MCRGAGQSRVGGGQQGSGQRSCWAGAADGALMRERGGVWVGQQGGSGTLALVSWRHGRALIHPLVDRTHFCRQVHADVDV